MAGVFAGRSAPTHRGHRLAPAAALALCIAWIAAPALSVEFLDGRVQVHGFGEMQIRALDEKFQEELDLAQWYNVINLELELDIAPDGFGPFDLVSAYVRAEGRYDAIYSQGFGMFPSVNTYGNDAKRLPERLRDATDKEYGGTIPATDRFGVFEEDRIQNKQPAPFPPPAERLGFPGLDTFFRQFGPDNVRGINPAPNLGTVQLGQQSDDPAFYVHEKVLDFKFSLKSIRGPAAVQTQILGPWLPKNFIRGIALNPDRANPFRGRVAPTAARTGTGVVDSNAVRAYLGDPNLATLVAPGGTRVVDLLDPMLSAIKDAPASVRTNIGNLVLNATFPTNNINGFGGDFMGGVVPCVDPTQSDLAGQIRAGVIAPPANGRCIRGSTDTASNTLYTDPNILGITKMTGGSAEKPFSPAPDIGNLGQVLVDENGMVVGQVPNSKAQNREAAQGLYVPSAGLVKELRSGHLDTLNFNYDQTDRAWNRGDSQETNKELKEAYVDLEMLDSRLWMRLGLQNIVWGKTELFRTTDQFNPQDLALASLPSLEESRIALWSARFVYSLYNVGPLEDVRLEFAANIDHYQNADLGACGEPFTVDLVCQLTNGIFAHSLLGVGVAGIDRPEDPWKDPSGFEVGGRIEWRWDRFSFALTDFYGYSDFPYPDAIFFYERGVDWQSGRPLVARLPGESLGTCGASNAGQPTPVPNVFIDQAPYPTQFSAHPYSMTPGVRAQGTLVRGGIGRDPDCLRPGGAVGSPNQFSFNEAEDDLENTNALEHHHANQQIFAWICAGTVGIASAFDSSACAWTIFSSEVVLSQQFLRVPFIELLTPVLAGEQTGGNGGPQQFMGLALNSQKYPAADVTAPLASLNRLSHCQNQSTCFNLLTTITPIFDRNRDGFFDTNGCDGIYIDPDTNQPQVVDPYNCDLRGFDAWDQRVDPFGGQQPSVVQTLDNSLTNEQRALLGCGPFYGSRCDSAVDSGVYGRFGGVDFMNMEASALVQSWPGFEGTVEGHLTTAAVPVPGMDKPGALAQPGTVGFVGGPVCTRFVAGQGTVKLPGCRGVASLNVVRDGDDDPAVVQVTFEQGYLPSVDGCVIGSQVFDSGTGEFVDVVATYPGGDSDQILDEELDRCNGARVRRPVPEFALNGFMPNGQPIVSANPACTGNPAGGNWDGNNYELCNAEEVSLEMLPLIHPVAGCVESDAWYVNGGNGQGGCEYFYARDLTSEFFDGTAALFQNELAAFSWNFLMFLTVTSCDARSFDLDGLNHTIPQFPSPQQGLAEDPTCFDAENPWTPGRCSYASPQYCTNVKGFLSAAGVTRNVRRAGGDGRYGRRTFIWHGGGEVVLRYEKRNVFGFATDFAEDVTKTNWGIEFTWIEGLPFVDSGSSNGISYSDAYNLTISVDRPTFINFLNPNRTFFFNTQWFFNYVPGYDKDWTSNGPVNVLFTFAMFTGYYQDRVSPQLVTVYDFNSRSGGLLPSLQYRFTESFSVTVGMLWFWGRTQLKNMPVNEFAPPSNRAGNNANKIGVDNGLSPIRQRDEVFLRLRWTF